MFDPIPKFDRIRTLSPTLRTAQRGRTRPHGRVTLRRSNGLCGSEAELSAAEKQQPQTEGAMTKSESHSARDDIGESSG
eukprot:456688-Pleurochrysis_carterae.AAC.3